MTPKQRVYRDFWAAFLQEFHERHPGWRQKTATESENHVDFHAGLSGLHYSANFCQRGNQPWFRIELYVDAKDKETATAHFKALTQGREAIEARFGAPLEWDPLEHRRASRIASYFPAELSVEDRDRWAEARRLGHRANGIAP